jgi:hypothetical protein
MAQGDTPENGGGSREPRLRLVKVVIQPHFVLDDGENLTEQIANPVEVSAADWPTYPTEKFPADVEEALNRLLEDESRAP